MREKVIIMGAAGRDFHNFNVYFRDNTRYEVVAFTAAQIEGIEGRLYPPSLAGSLYPEGIAIVPESSLPQVISTTQADLVVFSYSDVKHVDVMHHASRVQALGADFMLIGAQYTMLKASVPVIAVCAVRTGCGKSQTSREVCRIMRDKGLRVVAVRHPMPYGDLSRQEVQRFETLEDLDFHHCTIEEREEYEPLIARGLVVYAGTDYAAVLRQAEQEADVIVWDGGNNDTSFFLPDVQITVLDPHRAGHELTYYPGETNLLLADICVVNKVDTATKSDLETVLRNIAGHNPAATVVEAESPVTVAHPDIVRGKKVLVVEDGPTLTHGEMAFGAGTVAAKACGVAELVDPREWAKGSIRSVYEKYPHMGPVLPAMGYSAAQLADLEATINACECDAVIFGTPARLDSLLNVAHPVTIAEYGYKDAHNPGLEEALLKALHLRCPDQF